ncbi:MAG TPA: hypothetical protein VGL68_07475 [Solirubrobacteraceae bacterium]|jgi:hypothetical protein
MSDKTKRIACSSLVGSSLLFGVPVVLGIVVSVVRLLGFRYPYLGWATTVNSDAEELYLGHTLYQSPAHGYTGQVYTPLFPAVISLFDRLYLWNGWSLIIVIGASVSLAVLAARIAYARAGPAPRAVCLLGAAGIGGIAYWCVASIKLSLLDEGRADQMAWALALFGLIAVADFGPRPSRRHVATAALLLTAGLWTKQTTFAITGLAVAWAVGLAAISALDRRAVLLLVAVLAGVNLALLLILNILTHGWEFYFNFKEATFQSNEWPYAGNVTKGLQSGALAIGFVAVTWVSIAVTVTMRRRRDPARSHSRAAIARLRKLLVADDPTGRRALLIGLYIVFGFPLAAYIMRKQGTETNQMIGVVWALGLLAAAGWHVAQRQIGTAAATGGCVVLFFALTQLAPMQEVAARASVEIPALERAEQWLSVPAELRSWARDHTLYMSLFSDLNVPYGGPLYPNYYNFADLLSAGNQPKYLVRALLNRRFDGVSFIPPEDEAYTSANGKWEENYLWKLDEVIAARYVSEPGLPQGVMGRRPGPEQAAWMRHCFGPFPAAGASFRIHRGGGFWCSFSPERLKLVRTPTPLSEVVTTQPVRLQGAVTVSLESRASSQVDLVFGAGSRGEWVARVTPVAGRSSAVVISAYFAGALLASKRVAATTLPGGRRGVRLEITPTSGSAGPPLPAGTGRVTLTAPAVKAPFAVVATPGVEIDLGATRLGG